MEIYEKLQEKLGKTVQRDVPLKQYCTFKLGGPAKYFFIAKTSEDIVKAVEAAQECKVLFFILGGGSNILVSDQGFDGLVIKAENKNVEVAVHIIKAEAGVLLSQVVELAAESGLSGMEWAVGIPGTIGGAVRGNAGAFGKCIQNCVIQVEVLQIKDGKREIITMPKDQCEFNYRESIFKKDRDLIILGAEFKLEKGDKERIEKQMDDYAKQRGVAQPGIEEYPSAGCGFKNIIVDEEIKGKLNPEGEQVPYGASGNYKEIKEVMKGGKIGAAWFIDRAGLKGKQIGGVKVSDEHANFIVKVSEDAKADDVVMLISYIKEKVRSKFGVQLQEEVNYVGF